MINAEMPYHGDLKIPSSALGSQDHFRIGESFTFLSQGAILQNFSVNGHDIVLGFPDPTLYENNNSAFFGETIGRIANRTKDAILRNLNGGKTYLLAANEGSNNLHGGLQGWGKKRFNVKTEATKPEKREAIEFSYESKDGEEGFPGTVECRVLYQQRSEEGKTVLEVDYEVALVGDDCCEETVVSLTNHRYRIYHTPLWRLTIALQFSFPFDSYFNLNPSAPDIGGTVVTLSTNRCLELDSNHIPTGRFISHPSLPEPLTPFILGSTSPSFDDCFIINPSLSPSSCPLDTRTLPLQKLCTLSHSDTNLQLEILSTEPAFQFYTGDGIDVPELMTMQGEKVPARGARSGLAIEPSRFVNCAGREEWRNMCLLRKGEKWGASTVYRAWCEM